MKLATGQQPCNICHFWPEADGNHTCPDTQLVQHYWASIADRDETHRLNCEYADRWAEISRMEYGDATSDLILARINDDLRRLATRGKTPGAHSIAARDQMWQPLTQAQRDYSFGALAADAAPPEGAPE